MKRLDLMLLGVILFGLLLGCGQVPQPAVTPAGGDSPRTDDILSDPARYLGQEVAVEGVLEAEGQGRDVHFYLRGSGEARLEVTTWAPLEVMQPSDPNSPVPKIMLDYVGKTLRLTGVVTQAGDGYILTVSHAEELP
jgi:hypothetical protein